MIPKWKRAGSDGEVEIKFPTGRKFRVEKFYNENMKTGSIRHKGEWLVSEWAAQRREWEQADIYSPKWHAKDKVMNMGQWNANGKKVADYSKTFQSESVDEEAMTTADAGIPQDTANMGPSRLPTNILRRGIGKPINVTDRRRRKDKTPVLLKKFRTYAEEYNGASESLNENALKALRVATKAHKGQFRKSGGEYIDHPKEVARFVKQFKKSNNLSAMIQAAYLHDTLEDTDTTYADLVKQFGGLVADMVQQLTTDKVASDAIGKGEYITNKMAKMSSWALVVKLADRLANVQDIDTRPAAFQKKYAADTRLALKRLRSDRFLSKTHNKIMTAIEKKIKEY